MAISDFCNISNYMLDFEAMASDAGAVVLTAGLASWGDHGVQLEGYWRFKSDQPGRILALDTKQWWEAVEKENPEAGYEAFHAEPRIDLLQFRKEISEIFDRTPNYSIWSKPQDYDIPILEHINRWLGFRGALTPYSARNNCRSYWGAAKLLDPTFEETKPTVEHRSDHDTIALADTTYRAFQILLSHRISLTF